MLKVRNLAKQFSGQSSPLFHQLNIDLKPGEILEVRGKNGSGKTSLLRCLAGRMSPSQGDIVYNENHRPIEWASYASCDTQGFFPQLTLKQNIDFFQKFYGTLSPVESFCDKLE
ncbi:MAG: ATP-binding cassette domain-containing protein, partial [Pseudomonadota bacterium]